MVYLYTTGDGRVGERETQLRVRARLMAWASRSLAAWCELHGVTWYALPRMRQDLSILSRDPATVQPALAPAPA